MEPTKRRLSNSTSVLAAINVCTSLKSSNLPQGCQPEDHLEVPGGLVASANRAAKSKNMTWCSQDAYSPSGGSQVDVVPTLSFHAHGRMTRVMRVRAHANERSCARKQGKHVGQLPRSQRSHGGGTFQLQMLRHCASSRTRRCGAKFILQTMNPISDFSGNVV